MKNVLIVGAGVYTAYSWLQEYEKACLDISVATGIHVEEVLQAFARFGQAMGGFQSETINHIKECSLLTDAGALNIARNRATVQRSSYYIPPYFSIFGSNRPLVRKPISLPNGKVNRNVRPKATKTNRRFYR